MTPDSTLAVTNTCPKDGVHLTKQPMALTVGSRLGHYDVTALIGEGGMGQVYQATDTKLNRQVALRFSGFEELRR